jgi:hypothetical protein
MISLEKNKQAPQSYCAAEAPRAASLRPTRRLDCSCAASAPCRRAHGASTSEYISRASTSRPALRPDFCGAQSHASSAALPLHRAAASQQPSNHMQSCSSQSQHLPRVFRLRRRTLRAVSLSTVGRPFGSRSRPAADRSNRRRRRPAPRAPAPRTAAAAAAA